MGLKLMPAIAAVATVALELTALNQFGVIEKLGPHPTEVMIAQVSHAPQASPWLVQADELDAVVRGDHSANFKCGSLCVLFAPLNDQIPLEYHAPSLRNPRDELFI